MYPEPLEWISDETIKELKESKLMIVPVYETFDNIGIIILKLRNNQTGVVVSDACIKKEDIKNGSADDILHNTIILSKYMHRYLVY
jgi:hypothetical protein